MSKRQEMREKRKRQEKMQQLMVILGIALIALALAAVLILPGLMPVSDVVSATPNPLIADLPNVNGREVGDPNAKVVIEVWEDFQCPSCVRYSQGVEPEVFAKLVATGKARYIFRFYPFLDGEGISGGESDQAANAAMCASEQEHFWGYHAMLYANWNGENAGAFSNRRLTAYADNLGLDMGQFNACFKDNKYKDRILEDFQLGQQVGVTGTPSVFVNRVSVTPGYIPSYDDIAKAVEAALASAP